MLGHDELEHGVAEKLKALIIEMMPMGLVPKTRMSQRFRQEKRIAKLVTDTFFERIHWGLSLPGFGGIFQTGNRVGALSSRRNTARHPRGHSPFFVIPSEVEESHALSGVSRLVSAKA